ncbi:MAG: NAD(+) diphosphatase [Thermaurantiacus sp.]
MTHASAHLGYTGCPLDRADHIRRDPDALALARMHAASRWLVLDNLKPLLTPDGADLFWARRAEVGDGPSVFLGIDRAGAPCFAVDTSSNGLPGRPTDARAAGMRLGDGRAAIIAEARSLLDWHRRHQFCANCGAPTDMAKGGWSRHCNACGADHFPRVDPVVIMLAVKGEMALVGRQPGFPAGFLSALAGFVEPGESLEEAVIRELHEEAGLTCSAVRYLASQPWPFPSSLMIGAIAEADGYELAVDGDELEEARWVSREECAAVLAGDGPWQAPPPLAIAHHLLAGWVAGR